MKIIFVGVHNKINTIPLCSSTKSGKLIDRIINELQKKEIVKTNLYNKEYLPEQKDKSELAKDWYKRIKPDSKDIIVLLGAEVNKHFNNDKNLKTISLAHPSSIWSNKLMNEYVFNAVKEINNHI